MRRKSKVQNGRHLTPRQLSHETSEMVVVNQRGRSFAVAHLLGPGRGLPVVLDLFRRNPRGKRLLKLFGEREGVRLIKLAKFQQFLLGFRRIDQYRAMLRQSVADDL